MNASPPREVPPLLRRLVDDAALFPPARLPLAQALPAHVAHRQAPYADIVGPFLCPDDGLPALGEALAARSSSAEPLRVAVVVTGGAGAIGPALTWAARTDGMRLAGVEVALRDEPPLARNVSRIALAVDHAGVADDVPVSIEVPRTESGAGGGAGDHEWQDALDAIAAAGHQAKFRTGGITSDAFPTERELAEFVVACLDREVAFKCTAGLHHAVRNTSPEGFEQHGFLNIVLATRAALDGGSPGDIEAVLAERDPRRVADGVRALGDDAAASARRWFRSFGSCSVSEPVEDMAALGVGQD